MNDLNLFGLLKLIKGAIDGADIECSDGFKNGGYYLDVWKPNNTKFRIKIENVR